MHNEKKRKLWMLPTGIAMLLAGLMAIGLLVVAMHFQFPEKAEVSAEITGEPLLNRKALEWVPPTEPPTEPVTEPDFIYTMGIDLNKVNSYHASNNDVVGWVRIPDTCINYPIVQTNNNSFYVDHSWTGAPSFAGAIFADWRCDLDTTDNALVYGHNMGNGTMLHAIKNYKVYDWGMAHRYFEVASLTHRYLYRVVSCNVIYGEKGSKFEYWNYVCMNRPNYRYYYDMIHATAGTWYGDPLETPKDNQDRMIALQTCNSGASDGMRCVLFAVLVGDVTNVAEYNETLGLDPGKHPPVEQ